MTKMTNNQVFPPDFCPETTRSCLKLIKASCSFTLRAMPGLGVSFFLKHMANKPEYYWIPLNLYELSKPTAQSLIKYLANTLGCPIPGKYESVAHCIEGRIHELTKTHERIVLVFNRFDSLDNATGTLMLNTLRSIRDINREKIVFIFAASKSLAGRLTPQHMDSFNLFSKEVFLKPFSPRDLAVLLTLDKSASLVTARSLPRVIALSGGHHSLAQTLLRCQSLDNPLGDPMVRLQLDYLLSCLTPKEIQALLQISSNNNTSCNDSLVHYGFVLKESSKTRVFTKLMEMHLTTKQAHTLPPKEKALLDLLQHHAPNFVTKDEIIEKLWINTRDGGSEWALTALLYRLRKHPAFIASGNTIMTFKKRGYVLILAE
jgi:hypothetical protein